MTIDDKGLSERFFSAFSDFSQKEIVEFLFPGVPYQKKQPQVSKWKAMKEPIPWKILEYVIKNKGVERDWLLYGVGPKGTSRAEDIVLSTNLKTLRRSQSPDDFWTNLSTIGLKAKIWKEEWERGIDFPTEDELDRISNFFEIKTQDITGKILTESDYVFLAPTREGRREAALELGSISQEEEAAVTRSGNPSHAKAIYRLQKAISEIQIALAEAGLHVASGQSLKDYADLNPLLNNLQVLELPLQALVGILKAYQQPDVAGSSPLDGGDLGGAASRLLSGKRLL